MTSGQAIAWLVVVLMGGCGTALAGSEVKHTRVGDAELAYIEAGSGDPIVFIHGGLQDYLSSANS